MSVTVQYNAGRKSGRIYFKYFIAYNLSLMQEVLTNGQNDSFTPALILTHFSLTRWGCNAWMRTWTPMHQTVSYEC